MMKVAVKTTDEETVERKRLPPPSGGWAMANLVYMAAVVLCIGTIAAFVVRWAQSGLKYYSVDSTLVDQFFICLVVVDIFPLFITGFVFWQTSVKLEKLQNEADFLKKPVTAGQTKHAFQWSGLALLGLLCGVCVSIGITTVGNFSSDLTLKVPLYYYVLEIIALITFWSVFLLANNVALRSIGKYRPGRAFAHYTRYRLLPGCAVGLLVELFLLFAMMSQGQSNQYAGISTPLYWSAGYGAFWGSLCVTCTSLSVGYVFGCGLLKISDLEGSHIYDNAHWSKTNVDSVDNDVAVGGSLWDILGIWWHRNDQGIVDILKASLKYFYLLDALLFVAAISMNWTTFDVSQIYDVGIAGMTMFGVHALSIVVLKIAVKNHSLTNILTENNVRHHFFISHQQKSGGNQVHAICRELEIRGCSVWRDQDLDDEISVQAMKTGIENSLIFLIFLTDKYWQSWFCCMELLHAIDKGKRVIVIGEFDSRFQINLEKRSDGTIAETDLIKSVADLRKAFRKDCDETDDMPAKVKFDKQHQSKVEEALFGKNDGDDLKNIIQFERRGYIAEGMYRRLLATLKDDDNPTTRRVMFKRSETLRNMLKFSNDKDTKYHIYLSYADDTEDGGSRVELIRQLVAELLARPGCQDMKVTWRDPKAVGDEKTEATTESPYDRMKGSCIVMSYLTPDYWQNPSTLQDMKYTYELKKELIVVMPPGRIFDDCSSDLRNAHLEEVDCYNKMMFESNEFVPLKEEDFTKDSVMDEIIKRLKKKGT